MGCNLHIGFPLLDNFPQNIQTFVNKVSDLFPNVEIALNEAFLNQNSF